MTVVEVIEDPPHPEIGAIQVPVIEEGGIITTDQDAAPPLPIADIEQPLADISEPPPCPTTEASVGMELTDDDDDDDDDDAMTIAWKTSCWAVGKTPDSWRDRDPCLAHWTTRVGHMTVLYQRSLSPNNTDQNTTLVWILGPFWYIPFLITMPLIVGVSAGIYLTTVVCHDHHMVWDILWAILLAGVLLCLFTASWSNPGILPRHWNPPTATTTTADGEDEEWIWNDQALTYRPPKAKYDSACAVVVTDFDHVCPWVGTAIGSGNMKWFNRFLWMIGINLVYDCIIMATSGGSCGGLIKT